MTASRQRTSSNRLYPRHSLRWRLPLWFGALTVLMLATFLWATYRQIERTLVDAGQKRADEAADQIGDMLSRSVENVWTQTDSIRQDPALRAYLHNPTTQNRQAARRVLAGKTTASLRRIELWDARDSLVIEIAASAPDTAKTLKSFPAAPRPERAGVSPIEAADTFNFFHVTAELRDSSAAGSTHLGYLRRFGRVTSTAGGAVRRLVGSEAVVKVGTPGGTVWTDFFTIVDAPPGAHGRTADGPRWVAGNDTVSNTPWVVWVGFPRPLILAPAQAFMRRMIVVALLFVGAGVLLFGSLGVRLTRPLDALARAAQEIAAGDYTRRVANGRRDEIGQLSDAFNTMTDRIQEVYGALKESHEHTHFTLAAAGVGVWESDLATDRVTCSESMAAVHGLPAEALPHTRDAFLEFVHREDREAVRQVLEGRAPQNEMFDVQYRALLPDGSMRWLEGKGRIMLDRTGRPVSVLGVSEDVTDRRRLESQLRQAQKMEAIGQLAGGVAHDFNNLLTAIIGHGNMILGELPKEERVRDEIVEILKAGESAAGLTRQLLAFSRRQIMQPEIVALNDVVAHTEKLLRRLIGEHIVLVTDLAPDLHAVRVDPGQLEQVLVNLAVNARDAMPDGGTLKITTANVDLTEDYARTHTAVTAGRYVMLSVTDTGTGMDAETQAHLFEPFFTTKPQGKGTGLGLATVFGIVKQSGGHIYVYSEPGHGSRFTVYLPATAEEAVAPIKRLAAPKMEGGTETILIVEDHAPVRAIAKTILERIGYRVLVAASGEEALQALHARQARPDLVISDVIMPGMNGPELARLLAARYRGIRVLFTSGYSGDDITRHGVEEQGALFIEKPYSPTALAQKVREALETQPA